MNEEQKKIWKYLIESAQGIDNAIHIRKIAEAVGIPDSGTNNDNVRNWIKDLVINHSCPIGTCHKGAFIILNSEELEKAIRFVDRNSRIKAIRRNGTYKH
jgi:hypothetical protein